MTARHFMRDDAVCIQRCSAAIRQVGRGEVGHVDLQRDVRALAVGGKLRRDPGERVASAVSESGEIEADRIAVGLNAVVLLDHLLGRREPAGLQTVDDGQLAAVAHHALGALAEQELTVEARGSADAVDFLRELTDFLLQGSPIGIAVGRIRGLHGQFANTAQVFSDGAERTVGGLQHGHAVIGIAHALVEAAHLCGHAFGNGQARRIVGCAVDAQAGRQALQRLHQCRLGSVEVALRVQRGNVRVDAQCHVRVRTGTRTRVFRCR